MKVVQTISSPGTIVNVLTTGSPLTLDCDAEITAPDVLFSPSAPANWNTPPPANVQSALNSLSNILRGGVYANADAIGPTGSLVPITTDPIARQSSGTYFVWGCVSFLSTAISTINLLQNSNVIAKARVSPTSLGQYLNVSICGIRQVLTTPVTFTMTISPSAGDITIQAEEARITWLEIGG